MSDLCSAVQQAQHKLLSVYSKVQTSPSGLSNAIMWLTIQRPWLIKAKLHEALAETVKLFKGEGDCPQWRKALENGGK